MQVMLGVGRISIDLLVSLAAEGASLRARSTSLRFAADVAVAAAALARSRFFRAHTVHSPFARVHRLSTTWIRSLFSLLCYRPPRTHALFLSFSLPLSLSLSLSLALSHSLSHAPRRLIAVPQIEATAAVQTRECGTERRLFAGADPRRAPLDGG